MDNPQHCHICDIELVPGIDPVLQLPGGKLRCLVCAYPLSSMARLHARRPRPLATANGPHLSLIPGGRHD